MSTVEQVRANLERFEHALSPAALGAFAEIDEGNDPPEHRILNRAWGQATDPDLHGMRTREPIFAGADFHLGHVETVLGMRGVEHTSPTRLISTAPATHQQVTDAVLSVLTWHGPTHAYNGPDDAPHRPELTKGWGACWDAGRDIAADNNRDGVPTVFVGDMNRRHLPPLHAREHRLVDAGPDHLGIVVPHDWALVVKSIRPVVVDLTIDTHNGHAVAFDLRTPDGHTITVQAAFANVGR